MSSIETIGVDAESETVHIEELTVRDQELVELLEDRSAEQQKETVKTALRVGAATLQLAETSTDVEYVKREFEKMETTVQDEVEKVTDELQQKFGEGGELETRLERHVGEDGRIRKHIDDAFGEEGEFVERLDEELGEDGERIQEALNPNREGTPTYQLKQTLKQDIQAIRDELMREEGREETRQRSWQKGDDFEETLDELLTDLTYNTQDTVEHTGDTEGTLSGRDVGDFVLTLGETNQRIVVEAKSKQGRSEPQIQEEMEEAIQNRDADYGIFVTECESYVPDKIGYFQEYDDFLVVALSEDEDDPLETGFLHIAVSWAKMRAIQESVSTDESVDAEVIRTKVEAVRESVKRFSTVKRKCSDIQSIATDIKEELDEIQDEVTRSLNDINAELSQVE